MTHYDQYKTIEQIREIIVLQKKGRYRIAMAKLEQLEHDLAEKFTNEEI